jgi:hypothetical protein
MMPYLVKRMLMSLLCLKQTINNTTMTRKDTLEESILYLVAGIFLATYFIAMMCGDGNKGILDLL